MPDVVSIRFKTAGTIYYFDPAGVDFEVGDWVIVDTARGQSMGKVIKGREQIPPRDIQEPLKSVIRKAGTEEIAKAEELQTKEKEILGSFAELVTKHDLPMKLIAAEYNFDGAHLTIYFSAENKIDFRTLLKDMGSLAKTRVELRQIGARDVAKLLGGIGRCGRTLCCCTSLCKFEPISVRMARDQNLPLNPAMISGNCGKLLCCLKYEHEQYRELKNKQPTVGDSVITPQGPATIVNVSPIKDVVTVQLEGDLTMEMPVSQLKSGAGKRK
ncbi:MAG: regulatory iron-sulfur-containing complex subunit RicT [Planctomycetota bacterium]